MQNGVLLGQSIFWLWNSQFRVDSILFVYLRIHSQLTIPSPYDKLLALPFVQAVEVEILQPITKRHMLFSGFY